MEQLQRAYERTFRKYNLPVADIVYQCRLDTENHYHLTIKDGKLAMDIGVHPNPTVTLLFPDEATPLQICEGKLDPMAAFLEGHFRSDGHLLLVMQYLMLFGTLSAQADLR